MKKLALFILCIVFAVANIFAQGAKTELEKAQKAGKSIYLLVTDKNSKGVDKISNSVLNAIKTAKNAVLVILNRDEKANAELISKFRLSGASLPMVLVVAHNGVISGSISAEDVTVEKLIAYLPSKNQAEVLLGFENGKPAFIICGKKNAKDKDAIIAECKSAAASLGNKTSLVIVDVDNKEEKNFLDLIKPDMNKTTVLVFNGKGQYTGTLESNAKSADLVVMVNKKVGGGCCPGGKTGKSGCK